MKKIPHPSGQRDDAASDADASAAVPDEPGGDASANGTNPTALDQVRAAVVDGEGGADDAGDGAGVRSDASVGTSAGAPSGRTRPARSNASRGKKKTARGPARRFARERALQALYQWDMADSESSAVRRQFIEHQDMSRVDVEYFERLFRGISHDIEKVDGSLEAALDRPLVEVDPIERAVLRIAAFELAEVPETPARVIINEGVEITKRFGADNGHRYVNGVLDGLAATLRPLEMRRG